MRSFLTTAILAITVFACTPTGNDASAQDLVMMDLNAEEFKSYISDKGGLVLDVRTAEEVSEGHIPNSVNIDYWGDGFEESVKKLDKEQPVFVYCAAGGRSLKAMKKLNSLGFKEVYNLESGFPTWAEAGFEVAK